MEIKPFYIEDIAILAKRVSEIWRFDDSPEFTRIFCEYLVRCNYYSTQFSFMASRTTQKCFARSEKIHRAQYQLCQTHRS